VGGSKETKDETDMDSNREGMSHTGRGAAAGTLVGLLLLIAGTLRFMSAVGAEAAFPDCILRG